MIVQWLNELYCKLAGHRSICLGAYENRDGQLGPPISTFSMWKCERCGHPFEEQWDHR